MVNETIVTASPSVFASVIESWKKFGIFDIVLPFLLVFAITYGVLERTKLFGEKGPSVNAIIAFSIAMSSVLTSWFVSFMMGFLPWVSTISIVIICTLLLVAMVLEGDIEKLYAHKKFVLGLAGAVVAAITAVLIGFAYPLLEPYFNIDMTLAALGLTVADVWGILFFVAFLFALWFISRTPQSGGGGSE